MATTPKTTIGTMACMCCGQEIPVKQAENGTINAACNWCDFPAYAKKGTQAHRIITGRLKTSQAAPAPEPKTKPPAPAPAAPATPPAPAPRRATIFEMAGGPN